MAHITVKDAGYPTYEDLFLVYAGNETLWRAVWKEWPDTTYQWPYCPAYYPEHINDAWEFRYDSGRQRYLAEHWDTHDNPGGWTPITTTWTDYLGDEPWGDYDVTVDGTSNPEVTEQTRFLDAMGIQAQETLGTGGESRFFHDDLIGSTILTTNGGGTAVSAVSYTAFGEQIWHDEVPKAHVGGPLPAGSPRYGYAGAYGYESGPWGDLPDESASPGPLVLYGANPDLPPITLMHVGERWYEPDIGRFVQRDPIGLLGGLNAYAYLGSNGLVLVDPLGLSGEADPISGVGVTLVLMGEVIVGVAAGSNPVGLGLIVVGTAIWGRLGPFAFRSIFHPFPPTEIRL